MGNENNQKVAQQNENQSENSSHIEAEKTPVQSAPKKDEEYIPVNTFVKKEVKRQKQIKCTMETSQLNVSNPEVKKNFGLDSQIMLVPFDVILQRMDKELRDTFQALAEDLLEDYKQKDLYDKQWKLHGNGFFVNYQEGYHICIITPDLIYKGSAATDVHNTIYPSTEGTLISKEGIYMGGFKKGKSHGNGYYYNKITRTKYIGLWDNGSMVEGRIQGDQYKFKGVLNNGMAEGAGVIQFKKSFATYIGNFHEGKYNDKQAKYVTKNYEYSGSFINGMKEGYGTLQERPKGKIQKKIKYRPAEIFEGDWIEDYIVTTRAQREAKRINQEEGHQAVGYMFEQVIFNAQHNKKEGSVSEFEQLYKTTSKIDLEKRKSRGEGGEPGGLMAGVREINKNTQKQKESQTVPAGSQIPDYIEQEPLEEDW